MVLNSSLPQGKYHIIGLQLAFFKTAFVTLEIRNVIIETQGKFRLKNNSAAGKGKEDFIVNPVMVGEMKACFLKEVFTCVHCSRAFIPRDEENRPNFWMTSGFKCHLASSL